MITRRACWTCCLPHAMLCASRKAFRTTNSHETGGSLWRPVSDKLRSYAAARWELGLSFTYRTGQFKYNRVEVSRQHTRERERQMRRFKSAAQVQRVLAVNAAGHPQRIQARTPPSQGDPSSTRSRVILHHLEDRDGCSPSDEPRTDVRIRTASAKTA